VSRTRTTGLTARGALSLTRQPEGRRSAGLLRAVLQTAAVEDSDVGLLRAAADRVENLAARATDGTWTTRGLLASRPEVVAVREDGGTEHVAEARARSAEWITALSPAIAGPLAGWLRAAAREPVDPHAVALARLLAG